MKKKMFLLQISENDFYAAIFIRFSFFEKS